VRAAARRFSGFYPDPKDAGDGLTTPGRSLPRVRFWQLWEEPNGGTRLQPTTGAIEHYRGMLNAASSALRRVSARNVLVTGGTTDDGAIAPLTFWRQLLCLSRSPCPGKVRFDVAAHDPHGQGPPGARPRAGQFGMTRLGRLQRLLRKPLWITGVGWDTPPQNPQGASPARQARYLSNALYLADRAGAALVAWNGLQDRVSYLTGFPSIASGLFFNDKDDLTRDTAKPAFRAYRFPFAVIRAKAWGVAPRAGTTVQIEERRGQSWRRVSSVQPSRSGEFTVPVRGRGVYRARQAGVRSLAWRD
jgi:hypothetical protein